MTEKIITHVRIIDGLGSTPIENGYLHIENGKISAFGALQDHAPRPGDEAIAYQNCTLLPGLFDVHTHIYPTGEEFRSKAPLPRYAEEQKQILAIKNLQKHLRAGFTTVREVLLKPMENRKC